MFSPGVRTQIAVYESFINVKQSFLLTQATRLGLFDLTQKVCCQPIVSHC